MDAVVRAAEDAAIRKDDLEINAEVINSNRRVVR